jgi:DNA sulfur modification protein DndD
MVVVERALAATPAAGDTDVDRALKRLHNANAHAVETKVRAEQLSTAIQTCRQEQDACRKRLASVVRAESLAEFDREDERRMIQLAARSREVMREFLERATERKIDRLAARIAESFRFLLRKQTLVERVVIDPATFAITLYDGSERALAKERLSEGEKQIFAIAILWGLSRACARPLPAIIDTPMARLDAEHRRHLVERYFPHASHQVVVLSTDTEVDREAYARLEPHLARAYHLEYDEATKCTTGTEGYFWDSA